MSLAGLERPSSLEEIFGLCKVSSSIEPEPCRLGEIADKGETITEAHTIEIAAEEQDLYALANAVEPRENN